MKPRRPPVRRLAAGIVRRTVQGKGAARAALDAAQSREKLDARGMNLLTELVYGTVRALGTIDHLLEGCSRRPLDEIDEEILSHLRVAAYQLVFLDHVPPAVAVSEAVESVRAPHLKKFANGVLRAVGRLVASRTAEGAPSARSLPAGEGWVTLSEDVLPDPAREPADWLSVATSHPLPLVRRWLARFGLEKTLEIGRAGNSAPPIVLRTNVLRTTREKLREELQAAGIEAEDGGPPEAVRIRKAGEIGALAAIREGRASVQDETAMRVAPRVLGKRVLDLCAAPGGKTTHLAELLGDRGEVVATDASGARLEQVRENVTRLGLRSVRVVETLSPEEKFDAVLVDVPCSNTGVLRRRVEVRARLDSLEMKKLLETQAALLDRAFALVAPGGRVVYSTCSIEEEENEAQVKALLARRPGTKLVEEELTLPRRGAGDGGYVAVLDLSRSP